MSDATREAAIGEEWERFVEVVSHLLYYEVYPAKIVDLVEVMAENDRADREGK